MEIPIQELLKRAKEAIQFNSEQFEIDDDGVRKTVSINTDTAGTPTSYCPFEPYFFTESDTLYVSVAPSHLGSNMHTLGRQEWTVPKLGTDPIINPDPDDDTWNPPKQALTEGDWEMWIIEGIAAPEGKPVEVIIQTSATADPEGHQPWKNVWKVATWTVTDSSGTLSVDELELGTCNALEHSVSHPNEFEPVVWHNGTNFMARFTPAHLVFTKNGSTMNVTVDGGSMDDSTGVIVADGDVWYLKVDTSNTGDPSAADLQKASSPTTTQFAEPLDASGTDGEYWIKICTFQLDGDHLVPEMHWRGPVLWNPRPWSNVGDGARVISEFSDDVYKARTIKGVTVSTAPGVSITVTETGNSIEISAQPVGATGAFKIQGVCEGNLFSAVGLEVENGMVKAIDNVVVNAGECCDCDCECTTEEPGTTVEP